MQNLGGQTKSIMVFSEVAYSRNLLSPALSAGKTTKSLLVLILHLTGWEGSAVFSQRAISNAFSCREVYLALHMASCWVKHVTSHFVCFIIKFQALRKFSFHKTWSLTLEGATSPVLSTPTELLLNNSLGRREIWNWKNNAIQLLLFLFVRAVFIWVLKEI